MHAAKLTCSCSLAFGVALLAVGGCSQAGSDFPDALENSSTGGTDEPSIPQAIPGTTLTTTSEPDPDPEPEPDPESETSGGFETDGGSTGTAETCDTRCIQHAPTGWNGPAAVQDLNSYAASPACDLEGYDDRTMVAWSDLSAPPAECSCDCSPSGVSCEGSVRVYRRSASISETISCTGNLAGPYYPQQGVALDIPNVSSSPFTAWNADYTSTPHVVGGTCEATEVDEVPPAAFGSTTFACVAELDSGGCDPDQWCAAPLPQGSDAQLCIWREGSAECPAGSGYTERSLVHQSIHDSRQCTDCSCGTPTGSCEDPSVRLLSTHFAQTAELDPSSSCDIVYGSEVANYDISGLFFSAGDPVAECSSFGGTAIGGVNPNDPITVCCAA